MNSPARDWNAHPPLLHPAYKSTVKRAPTQPLVPLPSPLPARRGPLYGHADIGPLDHDLTRNGIRNGEPVGERIVVTGRVLDEAGRPLPDTLVEVWQANAAGRYVHTVDQHNAPLDPNFLGGGRCVSDSEGRYRFYTVKPGAYPWGNHHNGWRPAHIHVSLLGASLAGRLVTQFYFPGDPLLALDPIYLGVPEAARHRLIADFDIAVTEPDFALGYVFDVVLAGPDATPTEG